MLQRECSSSVAIRPPADPLRAAAKTAPQPRSRALGRFIWPILIFFALSTLLVWHRHLEELEVRRDSLTKLSTVAMQLGPRINGVLNDDLRPLRRLRHNWLVGRFANDSAFASAATTIEEELPFFSAIARVDAHGHCREVFPAAGNSDLRGGDLTHDAFWAHLIAKAQRTGRIILAPFSDSSDDSIIAVVVPVMMRENSESLEPDFTMRAPHDERNTAQLPSEETTRMAVASGIYRGAVIARMRLTPTFQQLFAPLEYASLVGQLSDGGVVLYHSPVPGASGPPAAQPSASKALSPQNPPASAASSTNVTAANGGSAQSLPLAVSTSAASSEVSVADRKWTLSVWEPDSSPQLQEQRADSRTVLLGGLLISAIIGGCFFLLLNQRWKKRSQSDQFLAHMESLHEVAAAIGAKLGSTQEILDRLAAAGRELMRMDRSGIVLFNEPGQSLSLVAHSGDMPQEAVTQFSLASLPLSTVAVNSIEPLMIDDVDQLKKDSINLQTAQFFKAVSIVLVPLRTGERRIGFLALSNSHRRNFSREDRRLAKLLGSQAGVILANDDLYQQRGAALIAQKQLVEQRERIFAVNAAIYQASSVEESLQRLVELAPPVLGVDVCSMVLPTENDNEVIGAAITPPYGPKLVGRRFISAPNQRKATDTLHMVVVEDSAKDEGVHPTFQKELRIGSAVYLPLVCNGRFVAMLVMIRSTPGPFSEDQLNMARLFGNRAAAAIENARLLEQTRRDVETKAMLLRELNHRVKNNLASIAALLSLGQPPLTVEAQQWLDRTIERIGNMARAHAMLSSSHAKVPLDELVEGVLPSLALVKSGGVQIFTDLRNAALELDSDRAVSLAMVIYELSYNALVHGLRDCESGVLTIRARRESAAAGTGQKDAGGISEIGVVEIIDRRIRISEEESWRGNFGNNKAAMVEQKMEDAASIEGSAFGSAIGVAATIDRPNSSAVATWRRSPDPTAAMPTGLGLKLVHGLVSRELRGSIELRLAKIIAQSGPASPTDKIVQESDDPEATVATVRFPLGEP